jgi:hypothetical protein
MVLSPGEKQSKREADQLPVSNAETRNACRWLKCHKSVFIVILLKTGNNRVKIIVAFN